MKIGIDIRNIGKKRTGDEVVFLNLVKNLALIDSQNEYKLFTDITEEKLLDKLTNILEIADKNNFEIISLATANKFSWNFWTLPKYLRKNPVDIYLTQYITPFFVPKKIKIVTIIHDISFNFYPQFIKFSDLFFLKTLIPMSLRHADRIIGVSKFTQDEIIKYYGIRSEKVTWIHNAVSQDFLAQDTTDEKRAAVEEKYHLPEKYILYLGTLQPRKNLITLLEAYNFSKNKIDNVKLVIAGGKAHNFDKNIDLYIKKYNLENDVAMPGFIDEEDKAAVMAAAEIFVSPSFYEGFGIPILEAMSVGTPIIASNITPHLEISGDAALFFNPKNPEKLAEKITNLLKNENLSNKLVNKGKNQAQEFSWRKTAEKMLEIFEGLGS
jgi:glycosyltransferase involved in cell wall biosynthesis